MVYTQCGIKGRTLWLTPTPTFARSTEAVRQPKFFRVVFLPSRICVFIGFPFSIRELFIVSTFRFQFYNFRFFVFVLWYFHFRVLFFTFSLFWFPRFLGELFPYPIYVRFFRFEWANFVRDKTSGPKKSLEIQAVSAFHGAFRSFSDGSPVTLFFFASAPPASLAVSIERSRYPGAC